MRRLLGFFLLAACAHASRSTDPANWRELESDHFVVRTDLPAKDAQASIADLERLRLGLLATGWHSNVEAPGKTTVVVLASGSELHEFSVPRLDGFVAEDAFERPIMVVSADQNPAEQGILKHELAHVITNEFLVSKPRWVAEGLACYLETLRFAKGKVFVGELSADRLLYLKAHPGIDYTLPMRVGREAEEMDADSGYSFETNAWLLVHWLYDTRQKGFDAFLNRLAAGEEWRKAFSAEFPDLTDASIHQGVRQYLSSGSAVVASGAAPEWEGAVRLRTMPPAEVHALRADLFRLSPGHGKGEGREHLRDGELSAALGYDPAHPLALELSGKGDAQQAVRAHPDDWRAWVLFANRNNEDAAALAKAAALMPHEGQVLARLALAEHNAGKRDEGLAHAVRAVELSPNRPDVLDVLARLQAVAGKCDQAIALEKRAIDALPDSASPAAYAELNRNLARMPELCGPPPELTRQVLIQPVQKKCARPSPRAQASDHVRGPLLVNFTIGLDGSVSQVEIKGNASSGLLKKVRQYVESCSYQPIVVDGKTQTLRTTVELRYESR